MSPGFFLQTFNSEFYLEKLPVLIFDEGHGRKAIGRADS